MKRKLLPLCILMAVLIIVISMTTVSFSWFEPSNLSGSGLKFNTTTFVSSTNCSIKTYSGDRNADDVIEYDAAEVTSKFELSSDADGAVTKYFKTIISNSNTNYAANVSLYMSEFEVTDGKASLAVIVPTNTYRSYTETQTDLHIIRNAYISKKDSEVTGAGELEVEWFVTCESGTVTFDPSNLYLMYD